MLNLYTIKTSMYIEPVFNDNSICFLIKNDKLKLFNSSLLERGICIR